MGGTSPIRRGVVLFLAVVLLIGCGKKKRSGDDDEGPPRNPFRVEGSQAGVTGVRRAAARPQVGNDFRQLGIYYKSFLAEFNRAPKNLDEFLENEKIKRDAPKIAKALTEGIYVLILLRNPTSNDVLVYERDADGYGMQMVLRGDCQSVTSMNKADLKKILENAK
jgi:hypothetical protein